MDGLRWDRPRWRGRSGFDKPNRPSTVLKAVPIDVVALIDT